MSTVQKLKLKMQTAYLQLWSNSFVNSFDEGTIRNVRAHPRCYSEERPPDLTSASCTVLDQLLRGLTLCIHNREALPPAEMAEYLYCSILPAIGWFVQYISPSISIPVTLAICRVLEPVVRQLKTSEVQLGSSTEEVRMTPITIALLMYTIACIKILKLVVCETREKHLLAPALV